MSSFHIAVRFFFRFLKRTRHNLPSVVRSHERARTRSTDMIFGRRSCGLLVQKFEPERMQTSDEGQTKIKQREPKSRRECTIGVPSATAATKRISHPPKGPLPVVYAIGYPGVFHLKAVKKRTSRAAIGRILHNKPKQSTGASALRMTVRVGPGDLRKNSGTKSWDHTRAPTRNTPRTGVHHQRPTSSFSL